MVKPCLLFSGSSEDVLTPFKDVLMALEGDTVTLSCNYSGSVDYLFWYQQKSSSSPQFLIQEHSEKIERLSFNHDKQSKKFHLQISSAAVTDSAVYYCALEPTVTGNSVTKVWLLTGVSSHVDSQTMILTEIFPACFTRVKLFNFVSSDVTLELCWDRKSFSTSVTKVWSFSCVTAHVDFQGFAITETFPTCWTRVRLLTSVNCCVTFKCWKVTKSFPTSITYVWLVPCVDSHVE
uniref:Ig-like domain-containing protein n=1 Tax=Stegastes partitus TaxID=144197 RepID=A0A3B5B862_9TELE